MIMSEAMQRDTKSSGRVALVTGASSGFGLLTSVELARNGYTVFATMRDTTRRGALDEAACEAGVEVRVLRLDVTDEASISSAVDEALRSAGRIDVLVNNAGYTLDGYFEDVSTAELREQFETNVFGLAAVTRAVLPAMRQRGEGTLINVSSLSGRHPGPGYSAYCASKAAVSALSESLREELAPFGIHVVLVEPGGYTGTNILRRNRRLPALAMDPASPYHSMTQALEAEMQGLAARPKGNPREVALAIVEAANDPRAWPRRELKAK
ncbi:SDR family NAD(P)-dependent oxidoreductase [Archangium violaceum]|uniref:SDR family NAD(P)-dependent oxidoreductase n=1 Tax=Archangium violaceum TaxID=83451 RepID=UPI002B281977|nr:SDR family NAD(P)-dependent oxidoreductase [Archangium gephyra]